MTKLRQDDEAATGRLLREFFLFGDGFALDGLALDGFLVIFKGGALEGAVHHVGFALQACALHRGVHEACGVVGGHALDGIGFLRVRRGHEMFPFILNVNDFAGLP